MTIKEKLLNHEVIVGTMLSEITNGNIVRLIKSTGYEFIFVDCEHGYYDLTDLANISAVGRGFGIKIIVRPPSVQREFMTKALDLGADGFLLPQVDTAEIAKKAVDISMYTPDGHRGISTTRAHTEYNPSSVSEYVKKANKEIILLAQIESREAVKNAYDIANIKGIDGLIIGPNDMAADCNKPGQTFTDEMKELITSAINSAKKANKPCGIVDSNIDRLHFWEQKGMSIFCIGSEIHMMLKGAKENITNFYNKN